MHRPVLIASIVLLSAQSASAQGKPQPRPSMPPESSSTSEQKAAEVKKWIEIGQQRQRTVDARNTKLWERWTLAICIGCGPIAVKYRPVFTTPARVLAGIPAADDDARRGSRL